MTNLQAVARTDESSILQGTSPASLSPTYLRTAFDQLQSLWRWVERKRTQQVAARRLRVAETLSLGEKRFVSIIKVDGAQYLIGGSATSVQLLAVLDQHDAEGAR